MVSPDLFTDIVESTARATELGDRRWHDLLERHNILVRSELTRFQGREVNTAGDSFLAMFDSPGSAIRCVCAIREAVGQIGLDIRAGLHLGECEKVKGDIRGIAVHIGARVAEMAGAGEILVSSTVKDAMTGSDISFKNSGSHVLKGIKGKWRLFAVQ